MRSGRSEDREIVAHRRQLKIFSANQLGVRKPQADREAPWKAASSPDDDGRRKDCHAVGTALTLPQRLRTGPASRVARIATIDGVFLISELFLHLDLQTGLKNLLDEFTQQTIRSQDQSVRAASRPSSFFGATAPFSLAVVDLSFQPTSTSGIQPLRRDQIRGISCRPKPGQLWSYLLQPA